MDQIPKSLIFSCVRIAFGIPGVLQTVALDVWMDRDTPSPAFFLVLYLFSFGSGKPPKSNYFASVMEGITIIDVAA